MADLETELLQLERELKSGCYRTGRYLAFEVHDPKPRTVSAAPFRDRIVHHALYHVVGPIFERGFIHDSYANRIGKGTHRAVARYERCRDRYRYVLRCDIHRYFPAIDHEILKTDLRRRVSCAPTLWLLDTIIDGSNPQEPVNAYYPGDDLFEPYRRRRGLPIGNLTSQFFANVYLDGLDHFCKEVLRARGYVRYVDDFALFHDEPVVLEDWRDQLAAYLARRRLSLHPEKTWIEPTRHPARYLGFQLLPTAGDAFPRTMSAASATASAACATGGAPGPSSAGPCSSA
jgi:retron-type reverse transcriptase